MRSNGEAMIGPRKPLDPGSLVIVLLGASAVGKSSLAERLCGAGVTEATPTWTTRKPRRGESDTSYDHRFVSDREFDRQSDSFIEQKEFYGNRYAVPFLSQPPKGVEALMVLKPVFIPTFISHFPATRIYQIEASPDLLPDRMRSRGQSQADIDERMRLHDAEAEAARKFAHVIFDNNGPLDSTYVQVEAQIRADRQAYDAALEPPPDPSSAMPAVG